MRLNGGHKGDPLLQGGELLELKDKNTYAVASFNSTIPSGRKRLVDIDGADAILSAMRNEGEDPDSVPTRDAYYFARGRRGSDVKVCLVHGSFFETIRPEKLISDAFGQAIDEAAPTNYFSEEEREKIVSIMTSQKPFSTTRHVNKASVALRFRVMVEAKDEGNILNNYEEIGDNTLNLVVPTHGKTENERKSQAKQINAAAKTAEVPGESLSAFFIKHPLNGYFWVLQIPLDAKT